MNIELKNIKFSELASQETNYFTADIFVNNKKIGYCLNEGCGGCTFYHAYEGFKGELGIVEEYCKNLPKIEYTFNGEVSYFDSNLEMVIDNLFEVWLKNRDNKSFQKKLDKAMLNSIVWGVPNSGKFSAIGWKVPIKTVMLTPNGLESITRVINRVKGEMKIGEEILNKNLDI